MMDFTAVFWKECKELISQGYRQLLIRLLLIAFTGIWLPIQFGSQWLQLSPLIIIEFSILPLLIVINLVADVFAGERERHTLETLLASRLSNWSIVIGKCATMITLSWGITVIGVLLGCIVTNMIAGVGHAWVFYPLNNFLLVLLLSFLTSTFATVIGSLISLHSSTVRQVQQTLGYCTIGLVAVGAFLVTQLIKLPFFTGLLALGTVKILLIVATGIAGIDVILLLFILALFQRSHLILD